MQERVKNFFGKNNPMQYDRTEITYIPVENVRIANYQRNHINRRAVAKIVSGFDAHLMRPIEVSYRNGEYFCWDGQHRLTAYRKMGYKTIPCHIHTGLSYADEARLFVRQQQNVTTIKSRDIWNAMVEAGDSDAKMIAKCCAEFKLTAQPTAQVHGNVNAVKALQDSYKMLGQQGFKDVLYVLTKAWCGDKGSLSSDNILGLSMFIKQFNLTGDYEINRIADVLGRMTPGGFAARCGDYRAIRGGKARAAQTILEQYNKGLGYSSPKRLPKHAF